MFQSFSSIKLACAVSHPGPCLRVFCEPVALLLSKNMTCARLRCNATPSDTLCSKDHTPHPSHCTLHTPHFTLRISHSTLGLISSLLTQSHLVSPHLISFLLRCHLSSSQLSSHPSTPQLLDAKWNLQHITRWREKQYFTNDLS